MLLGYGLNSYFSVVLQMMVMMGLVMLISLPLMMIYASYDDLKQLPGYNFNRYSLGNLGGSNAVCGTSEFTHGQYMPLSCSSGLITIDAIASNTNAPIFEVGIVPTAIKVNTYCTNTFEDPAQCSKFVNKDALRSYLNTECVGKQSCYITKLLPFVNRNLADFDESQCFTDESSMFIQVGCIVSEQDLAHRKCLGLFIGCAAVFVALFIINYTDYIKKR